MKKILIVLALATYVNATDSTAHTIRLTIGARVLAVAKGIGLIPVGLLLTGAGIYNGATMALVDDDDEPGLKLLGAKEGLIRDLLLFGPATAASFVCAGVSFVWAFKNFRAAVKGAVPAEKCEQKSDSIQTPATSIAMDSP